MNKTTLIIGASPKEDRYANMAQKALAKAGHRVIPMNPRGGEIDGLEVVTDLDSVAEEVDTVTVYVRPQVMGSLLAGVIALKPKRVIFNPGTEDAGLERQLGDAGIKVIEACTLVMLKTGQY